MDDTLSTFADRLKAKLSGAGGQVHASNDVTDLVDAQLDLVGAAHGSAHGSGHLSVPSSELTRGDVPA